MHLDGDLDAVLAGQGVDLSPERQGDLVPLVVQRIEIA